MTNPFEDESGEYLVLVNEEGQYSLWPGFRDVPNGWTATGPRGNRKECLAWIEETWTDMRPLSLVREMEKGAASGENTCTCSCSTAAETPSPSCN